MRGRVRKLRGAEANILANTKEAQKGDQYTRILRGCWEETIDAGPYSFEAGTTGAHVPWGQVLVCDQFYALAAVRIATYGSEYVFPVQCESCSHKYEWSVDIEKDLDVYDLPEESRTKIKSGSNRFETELGEHKITFCLQTIAGQGELKKKLQRSQSKILTTSMMQRIVQVNELTTKSEIENFLLNVLGFDDQLELMLQFEEVDGGFETSFEVACPSCAHEETVNIPFEGEDFWIPLSRLREKSSKTRNQRKKRKMVEDG